MSANDALCVRLIVFHFTITAHCPPTVGFYIRKSMGGKQDPCVQGDNISTNAKGRDQRDGMSVEQNKTRVKEVKAKEAVACTSAGRRSMHPCFHMTAACTCRQAKSQGQKWTFWDFLRVRYPVQRWLCSKCHWAIWFRTRTRSAAGMRSVSTLLGLANPG